MSELNGRSGSPEFHANQEMRNRVKRRRVLPLAGMATAALGLTGCGMFGGHAESGAAAPVLEGSLTPERRAADQQVQSFTSNIELALDKVDRERLRAAAEKKGQPVVTPAAASAVVPAASPAAAGASPVGSQAPVILASSNASEGAGAAGKAAVVPVTPAAVPVAAPMAAPSEPASATTVARQANVMTPSTAMNPSTPLSGPASASVGMSLAPLPSVSSAAPLSGVPAPMATPLLQETAAVPAQMSSATIAPMTPKDNSPPAAMGAMAAAIPTAVNDGSPLAMVGGAGAVGGVGVAAPTEPSVEEALAVLRKTLGSRPTLSSALALALLETGDSKSSDMEMMKHLSDPDQKVVGDLVGAIESMKTAAPGATLADRAAPLVEAAKKWQAEADLSLPHLVLATRVDSFGVYSAVEPKFEQGKRHTVIIYCEVANFASKKGDDGWYTTKLAQQETLITDDGLLVWRPNAEDVEDRSMNQRHDFYLVKKLTIPENLAAGKYTLRMSVTDRTTNKMSMLSLPVELVAGK